MVSEVVIKFGAALLIMVSVLYSRYVLDDSNNQEEHIVQVKQQEQLQQLPQLEQKPVEQVEQLQQLEQLEQKPVEQLSQLEQSSSALNPIPLTPYPTLSDEEVFQALHPKSYLNYLGKLEDLMVKDGILKPHEKSVFNSEDEVLEFWRKPGFSYMLSLDLVDEKDRAQFERGLVEVKTIHGIEARQLRAELGKIPAIEPNQLAQIGTALRSKFLPEANAQTCFVPGPPVPGPGVNLIAPCCNCFAGPFPIGCLNAVCVGRPALYDQTTFICGCSL